jgi:hypothetical protein
MMTFSFTALRLVLLRILAVGSEMRSYQCLCVLPHEAKILGVNHIVVKRRTVVGPLFAIVP